MTHSDSGEHNIPTAFDVVAISGKDEERLLIELARNGDQEAFAQVVYKCDRGVLRLAYRMMGNAEDAQDVYQETFLKAYRYLHKFRFESSLSPGSTRSPQMCAWIAFASARSVGNRTSTRPILAGIRRLPDRRTWCPV